MDASTWYLISIVGYSLAGVLLIVVVLMFFKMNIPAIIGDLNGKTAARQIQEIREKNKLTGNKQHRPSTFNVERGTLTAPVSSRFDSDSTEVLLMNETEVLEQGSEILINETEVLDNGTVVLAEDIGTTVLNATGETERENVTVPLAVEFKMVKDIKITHSNEVI